MNLDSGSKNNSDDISYESQLEEEECESVWLLRGPPFDPRDYMISPSDSESASVLNKDTEETSKEYCKLQPHEVRVDSKYILDSQGILKKLLELKEFECNRPLLERIQGLIRRYLNGCRTGFPLEDIPAIVEVVEYFTGNHKSVLEFKHELMLVVDVAKKPPIMTRGLDTFKCKKILTDYFTMFGKLLASFEDECFQIQVLQALNSIIFTRNVSDVGLVKASFCIEALEESQLPYALAALMETISPNLYLYYMEMAIQMAMASAKAGLLMLHNNIISYILRRIDLPDCPDSSEGQLSDAKHHSHLINYYVILEKSSFLVWSLLSKVKGRDEEIPSPDEHILRIVKKVFDREIMKTSQKAVRVRNSLAGLIVKCCSVFGERLPLLKSGWIENIAVLAVLAELGTQKSCLEGYAAGTERDYILKELMLLCCCLLPKKEEEIEALRHYRVIEGVVILISSEKSHSWFPSQFFNLFRMGMNTIAELIQFFPEECVRCKVFTSILSVMNHYKVEKLEENILRDIIITIYAVVACESSEYIIEDIKAQGAEESLLELYRYLINIESMKIFDQEKLAVVLIVLAKILKNDEHLINFHSQTIMSSTTALLRRMLQNSYRDSRWDSKLFISCGVFIWESIALYRESTKKFMEEGGIFLLIDLIEVSLFPIQMFFLGILVEMTQEGDNIAHLLTWRGKNGYGILDLMISIWRKEEYFTKVLRTPEGLIQDIEKPLMTEEQWLLPLEIANGHNYCASVAEMVGSARPKIHALYHFLQQKFSDLTKIGESSYSMQFLNVHPSNQVYIPLVEHYLSLKMGEIWYEVLRDVHLNGITPTAFDGDVMCTLLENKKQWSSRIKALQEEIVSLYQSKNADYEIGFYKLLNSCTLTSALQALRQLDYIGRTSIKHFQKGRKSQQIENVKNCFDALSSTNNIHRTFIQNTNVTFMELGRIFIKSEEEVSMGEEILSVSSESSAENWFDSDDET